MVRVRELRESRGMQQKELAIDLCVSQPTVSDWESGRKVPSARSTQKLADYFGVSIDYLLGRDEIEKKLIPDNGNGLSAEQLELIRLFESASPAIRTAALAVLRSAEEQGKVQDGASTDE